MKEGDTASSPAAVFRCLRAYLGLTPPQLAGALSLSPRTVQRFEAGTASIPPAVFTDLVRLAEDMERAAAQYVAVGEVRIGGLPRLGERAVGQALREHPELRVTM